MDNPYQSVSLPLYKNYGTATKLPANFTKVINGDSMKTSYVVESVSWHDLESLKPMQTIIFKDPESIDIISEFAEVNKDKIKCVCTKVGQYDYAAYFKPIKYRKLSWHKPKKLSPEFLEEHLFRMRDSNIVTATELRDKVFRSFAATMPEKLSPIYEHMLEDDRCDTTK